MRRPVYLAVLLLFPLMVAAKANFAVDAEHGDFAKQKHSIEKALASNNDLREISAEDRSQVLQGLEKIGAQLAEAGTLAALSPDGREQVLAEQEAINLSLERAMSDSRQVCTLERAIGSNMSKRKCVTVAAKRRMYEQTQREHGGSPELK